MAARAFLVNVAHSHRYCDADPHREAMTVDVVDRTEVETHNLACSECGWSCKVEIRGTPWTGR